MSRAHRIGILFATLGLLASTYLLAMRIAGVLPPCAPPPFDGCGKVETSVWSSVGPIPVAAIGVIGSAVLLLASIVHARTKREGALALWLFAGLVGAAAEIGFISIQEFLIHAWCIWCLFYGTTVFICASAAISASRAFARSTRA